jgi:hypothetical protein
MRKLIDRHSVEKPGSLTSIVRYVPVATPAEKPKRRPQAPPKVELAPLNSKEKREAFDARYKELTAAAAQGCRKAFEIPMPQRQPTKREVLDGLEAVEIALSSMMRRWQGGIPAEVRAEIMTEAYEPVLYLLIRTQRRGQKRGGHGGPMLMLGPKLPPPLGRPPTWEDLLDVLEQLLLALDLLAHVAPLGWGHIALTGDYDWTNSNAAPDFRPLRDVPSVFIARAALACNFVQIVCMQICEVRSDLHRF